MGNGMRIGGIDERLCGGLERRSFGFILCRSTLGSGNYYENLSPGMIGFNLHLALELTQPLLHSTNAYAGTSRLNLRKFRRRHAIALIADLDCDLSCFTSNSNSCRLAPGMAMDVGQAFLDQSEDNQFHVARQSAEVLRDFKVNL
jgi:hypothetical protein